MSIVREAVEERVGEKGVVEQTHPLIHMAAARHDRGGPAVPLDHHLVEVLGLHGAQALESEIINDEDGRIDQADELLPEGVVRPALVQPLQKGLRPEHEDTEPSPHGGMAQGIGQVRLPDSDGAADQDVLVVVNEGEVEEIPHPLPVERDWDVPLEPLDRLVGIEGALSYPPLYRPLVPPLDLVTQHKFQKLLVGELLSPRVGDPLHEGEEDAREAEPLEHLFQFGLDLHISSFIWSRSSARAAL